MNKNKFSGNDINVILTIDFLEFWLGLKYNHVKRDLLWLSNGKTAQLSTIFLTRQNSSLEVGDDKECVVYIDITIGVWLKTECHNERNFICERSIEGMNAFIISELPLKIKK